MPRPVAYAPHIAQLYGLERLLPNHLSMSLT
jgi:hypothetical protein